MALSLNEQALALAKTLTGHAEVLGVAVYTLPNGAHVIDCGLEAPGGRVVVASQLAYAAVFGVILHKHHRNQK